MKQHLHIDWTYKVDDTFILNLDEGFKPIVETSAMYNLQYKKFDFLGGEPHFQITSDVRYIGDLIITQRVNSIKDFFDIILANDAARRMGFKNIKLVIPYFPAARQDRVCNEGEPLTLKVFADMINDCRFDAVFVFTPHSEVTAALLDNVVLIEDLPYTAIPIVDLINRHNKKINSDNNINIVCPDAGAGKRVGKIVQYLSSRFPRINFDMIRCEKVRDVKDGSLKDFYVQADDLGNYFTIIYDDINCLAGTFIGLGKKLKEKNCGPLYLFTSHSDNTQGIQNAIEFFDMVYTSDSKQNWDQYKYTFDDKFKCFNIVL